MGKSVSFTGHRAAPYDFESALGLQMQNRLQSAIKAAISQGHDTFYTGMARGFDLIAAQAVVHEKENFSPHIKLVCVIPHRGQELKWAKKWRICYEDIKNTADEIIELSEKYIHGCFHERNRVLVEKADLVICFFSGQEGGTRHTVELAEEKGVPIVNVWED